MLDLQGVQGEQEMSDKKKQIAAVIVFQPDITFQAASDLLWRIRGYLESEDVQQFNPKHGSPVFYIP